MSALAIHRPGLCKQNESADDHLVEIERVKRGGGGKKKKKSQVIPIKLELDLPGMHTHPEDEIIGAQVNKPRV